MPKAKVNEINIYYKVHGQGEPLVLIQGLGGPRSGWIFQTRAFKKYYRVITFDNRGVGKSDKPSSPYTVRTMADDTIGLLDYLGVDKAHVLGVSLGGMIAQEIAINYPDRVNKLILGCTTAGLGDIERTEEEVRRAIGLREDFTEADIEALYLRSMGKIMATITSLAFNRRLFKVVLVPGAKIYFRFGRVVKGIVGQVGAAVGHSTLDRLHQIKAPTLVIVGTEDKLVPPRSSEVLAERIPNARLVKVEGGSHSFFVEMRGRFNKEVLDFLAGS